MLVICAFRVGKTLKAHHPASLHRFEMHGSEGLLVIDQIAACHVAESRLATTVGDGDQENVRVTKAALRQSHVKFCGKRYDKVRLARRRCQAEPAVDAAVGFVAHTLRGGGRTLAFRLRLGPTHLQSGRRRVAPL